MQGKAATQLSAVLRVAGSRSVVSSAVPRLVGLVRPGSLSGRGAAMWALGPEAVAPAPRSTRALVAAARVPPAEPDLAGALQLLLPHNIWSEHSLNGVQLACMRPGSVADSTASGLARTLAESSAVLARLSFSRERGWLRQLLFLSTLSGAPAVATRGRAPNKWTKALRGEADQQQARLQILMEIHNVGCAGRGFLHVVRGIFANGFKVAQLVTPRFCKWFGNYVDEEQVQAYTLLLEDLNAGHLPRFASATASSLACRYYDLPDGAPLREVFLRMRAEEMLSL
mmetsp:Transcript_79191/g.229984  ORF Transcript_79191/g.229984 Transcript_79191/m.229984 type:complete len:284 (-) Transcript_79191:265-1116(-)